jgi:hypothetical protein
MTHLLLVFSLAYLKNSAFSNPEAAEDDKVIDGYVVPRKVRPTGYLIILFLTK